MFRSSLSGVLLITLLTGGLALSLMPGTVAAQQPAPQHTFNRQMATRIDAVQSQIRSLERQLDGDAAPGDRPGQGGADTYSGLRQQLKAMDEQCRRLERELLSMGAISYAGPYEVYQKQRQIEYNVRGMERQIFETRKWVRQSTDDADVPVEREAEPAPDEEGMSDEDWAEEWAKGGG